MSTNEGDRMSETYILKAKGQNFDGYRIIDAPTKEVAENRAKYMFDLDGIDWHLEKKSGK